MDIPAVVELATKGTTVAIEAVVIYVLWQENKKLNADATKREKECSAELLAAEKLHAEALAKLNESVRAEIRAAAASVLEIADRTRKLIEG